MKFKWFKRMSPIMRHTIIGLASSLILLIVGAFLSPMISNLFQSPGESDLRLVDISFIETDEFPKLDVILRNTGEKVALLKRADFTVERIWQVPYPPYKVPPVLAPVPVSWDYDVMFSLSGAPYPVSKKISQDVKPNETDRFTFTLGDERTSSHGYVFLMTMELIYDEDDKILTSGNLVFEKGAAQIFSEVAYDMSLPEYSSYADYFADCRSLAEEIDKIDAIKNESLEGALRAILAASAED